MRLSSRHLIQPLSFLRHSTPLQGPQNFGFPDQPRPVQWPFIAKTYCGHLVSRSTMASVAEIMKQVNTSLDPGSYGLATVYSSLQTALTSFKTFQLENSSIFAHSPSATLLHGLLQDSLDNMINCIVQALCLAGLCLQGVLSTAQTNRLESTLSPLVLSEQGSFQISVFEDLHFGESR